MEYKKSAFNVFISGQKYFGAEVFRLCVDLGCEIVGVCCPVGDGYIGRLAALNGVPIVPGGGLNYETMPKGVDLGISAHSFDYIGKKTRYAPRLGWVGFHPSLLPRHRGRSAIEWALRMRDPVIGGSVFWLNAGIDRGDIERQDWRFIDPALFSKNPRKAAADLWRSELLPMGVELMRAALTDIMAGKINKAPQDNRFSTWEPSTDVNDIYRPDALMLPAPVAANLQAKNRDYATQST